MSPPAPPSSTARIGSVLFFIWLLFITPPFALLACLIAPLPPLLRYRIIAQWSRLTQAGLAWLCGVRYRVLGAENIPPQPVVFLSRHESAWETIAYQVILPPQVFVLKKSLLYIPFFGWGLQQMSPIAINRQSGMSSLRQVLAQGAARLAVGFSVVVFPEGSRMLPQQTRRYFSGGAALAKHAAVPLVPIAVDSGKCWGRNKFFKQRGCITVRIGRPIDPASGSAEELTQQAKTWIEAQRKLATSDG